MERHMDALQALKQMEKPMITAAEAAPVLGCDPHWIRLMARQNPSGLGFPVTTLGKGGKRTKIPRIPFIQYIEGSAGA